MSAWADTVISLGPTRMVSTPRPLPAFRAIKDNFAMYKESAMFNPFLKFVVCLAAVFVAPSAWAGGPPTGVYGCYDAMMDYKMRLTITPMPFVMFGLIDGTTYADYDGHRGHYTYDEGSGMLTMTDGSRQGWRYHKVDNWSFRLIDNTKGTELYTCPFNAGKDPARGPW
jgi:hypothetical protein